MILAEIVVAAIVLGGLFLFFANGGALGKSLKNSADRKAKELNEKVRDKVADGQAAIKAAKTQLAELRDKRRRILAANELVDKKAVASRKDMDKWHGLAQAEGRSGNNEAVLKCVQQKRLHEGTLKVLTTEMEKNTQLADAYKAKIDQLEMLIRQAEHDVQNLETREALDQFRKEEEASAIDGSGVIASLENLRGDAAKAEAYSNAFDEEEKAKGSLAEIEARHELEELTEEERALYLTPPAGLGPKVSVGSADDTTA